MMSATSASPAASPQYKAITIGAEA